MSTQEPAGSKALRRGAAWLLAAGLLASAIGSAAAAVLSSDDRLRQFMQTVRAKTVAGQSGGQAVRDAAAVSPARLQERADLIKKGETALSRLQVTAALDAFERAALILHGADTEIALMRGYMQSGNYRRALTFGAHTAGAHLDVVGGALLYAWLLHAGGQPAIAQQLLADTEARMPGEQMVREMRLELRQEMRPELRAGLLQNGSPSQKLPTRLAPYASTKGLPRNARVVGSAVLLPGGVQALVPLALVPRSGQLWLRNGLGQLTGAAVDKKLDSLGVALVRLQSPLPMPDDVQLATNEAFPGSPGFAVEYAASADAAPAWPVLRTGFLGGIGSNGERLVGIDLPAGAHGGPVFDGAGQLMGLVLPGKGGSGTDRLVTAVQLRAALGTGFGALPVQAAVSLAAPSAKPRAAVDAVYESSLKTSLQAITAP